MVNIVREIEYNIESATISILNKLPKTKTTYLLAKVLIPLTHTHMMISKKDIFSVYGTYLNYEGFTVSWEWSINNGLQVCSPY